MILRPYSAAARCSTRQPAACFQSGAKMTASASAMLVPPLVGVLAAIQAHVGQLEALAFAHDAPGVAAGDGADGDDLGGVGGVGPGGGVQAHRGQLQLLAEGQDRRRVAGGDRADRDDLALGREVAAAVVGRGFGGRAGHAGDDRRVVFVDVVAVKAAAKARDAERVGTRILPDAVGQRAGAAAAVLGAPDVILRQVAPVQAVADEIGRGVEDAVVAGGLDFGEEGAHHLSAGGIGQGEDAGFVLDVIGQRQSRIVALGDFLRDD